MAPLFRSMENEADWADGLVLWEKVFGVGPWLFHSLHRGHDDRRIEDVSGAWIEGELASAVDFFIRPTWGMSEAPRAMGGIGSVATLAHRRSLGLSSQLLDMALDKMEQRGCEWSILFTGVNGHYAKKGWKTMPHRNLQAELAPGVSDLQPDLKVKVKTHWNPGEPALLAPLFDQEFAGRPLVRARTPLAWDVAVRERLNRPGVTTFLASEGEAILGYAVFAFEGHDWGTLIELAGSEEGRAAALTALAVRAAERGLQRFGVQLPEEMTERPDFASVAKVVRKDETGHTMARPIGDRMSWDEIEEAFASPRGCHLRLDDF